MSKNILQTPEITGKIIDTTLKRAFGKMKDFGVEQGAAAFAIIFEDGEIRMGTSSTSPIIKSDSDTNRLFFPFDEVSHIKKATNIVLRAVDRLAYYQKNKSYPEKLQPIGCRKEICFYRNPEGEEIRFFLVAGFSGSSKKNNERMANELCFSAWPVVTSFKNPDGTSSLIYRVAGSCP